MHDYARAHDVQLSASPGHTLYLMNIETPKHTTTLANQTICCRRNLKQVLGLSLGVQIKTSDNQYNIHLFTHVVQRLMKSNVKLHPQNKQQ